MWKPVPLPDGSYADTSRPFSDQDVVNYWCEPASGPGTRSQFKLVQLPGLRPYVDFGAGPHRGARNVEGKLFVVSDTHAYWVKDVDDVVPIGEVPGRGRVWISHNQDGSGAAFQVMFSTGPDAWIWDLQAETWTKVTDEGFKGARSLIYNSSRFLGIEQQRRRFSNSDEGDGLAWDSVETYQAESSPDRLVALIDYAGEVLVFNQRTREHFQPSLNPDDIANHIYYTRIGPPVERGAASVHGVSRLDGRVFFVGDDGAGYFVNGYGQTRVTTPAIEAAWQKCDLSKAFCYTYESRGHSVWYVTFPTAFDGGKGMTWGYDCLTQKWHRRQTIGLDRWRVNTLVQWTPPGGDPLWLAGAYNAGTMYVLDWDYFLDGCDEIVREFTTGVLHDEGNRVTLNALRLECDTGSGSSECVEPVDFLSVVGDLPDNAVGGVADLTYQVYGGTAPMTLTIVSGALPDGLSMDTDGVVSGTFTTAGSFSWTVQVEDDLGATATVDDTCEVLTSSLEPQAEGWRWLQTTLADNDLSYAATDYDDSAWETGDAPFANGQPTTAHTYDPRFTNTPGTLIDMNSRIWIRRHMTLGAVPEAGFQMVGYFDNAYLLYINGVLASDGSTLVNAGVTETIDASFFVVGDNVIAVQCSDDAGGDPELDAAYFDFLFDPIV